MWEVAGLSTVRRDTVCPGPDFLLREEPSEQEVPCLRNIILCVLQLTTAVTSAFLLAKVILSKVCVTLLPCTVALCHGEALLAV